MKKIEYLMRIFFPPKCIVCGELIGYTSSEPYCAKCYHKLSESEVFSEATNPPDYIEQIYVLYSYDNISVKKSVFHAKNIFTPQFSEFYSGVCERLFQSTGFISDVDIVTYSTRRFQEMMIKGHDQAKEMAKSISRLTGICWRKTLIRTRKSKKQRSLNPIERAENVRDLFRCTIDLSGKSVLLVDDVMTTGSTLSECAKALKNAGAKSVIALVFAT